MPIFPISHSFYASVVHRQYIPWTFLLSLFHKLSITTGRWNCDCLSDLVWSYCFLILYCMCDQWRCGIISLMASLSLVETCVITTTFGAASDGGLSSWRLIIVVSHIYCIGVSSRHNARWRTLTFIQIIVYVFFCFFYFFLLVDTKANQRHQSFEHDQCGTSLIGAEWQIYASVNYAIFASDNGLSSGRWQAIILINAFYCQLENWEKNKWIVNKKSIMFFQRSINSKISAILYRPRYVNRGSFFSSKHFIKNSKSSAQ